MAKVDPANRFSNNHGKPVKTAVSKPLGADEEKTKENAEPKKEGVEPKKEGVEPKKESAEPGERRTLRREALSPRTLTSNRRRKPLCKRIPGHIRGRIPGHIPGRIRRCVGRPIHTRRRILARVSTAHRLSRRFWGQNPSPACGRRWREAPDEGLFSILSLVAAPHPNPLPRAGEGAKFGDARD